MLKFLYLKTTSNTLTESKQSNPIFEDSDKADRSLVAGFLAKKVLEAGPKTPVLPGGLPLNPLFATLSIFAPAKTLKNVH